MGINNYPRLYNITRTDNITGILERPLMKRSIIYITEFIKPIMDKILILFDSGITFKISVQEVFQGQSSVNVTGIHVDLKLIGELSEWRKIVLSIRLKGYDVVIVGLYQTIVDENGEYVKAIDIINWTSKNTTVPPFGFWDFTMGRKRPLVVLFFVDRPRGRERPKWLNRYWPVNLPVKFLRASAKKGGFIFPEHNWKNGNSNCRIRSMNRQISPINPDIIIYDFNSSMLPKKSSASGFFSASLFLTSLPSIIFLTASSTFFIFNVYGTSGH